MVPVIFIFATIDIFLQVQFGTSIFRLLGIGEFLFSFFPEGTINEKQMFGVLMTLWFFVMLLSSLFNTIFKKKIILNPRIVSQVFHIFNLFLWLWIIFKEQKDIILPIAIISFLHLMSYYFSLIYISTGQSTTNQTSLKS